MSLITLKYDHRFFTIDYEMMIELEKGDIVLLTRRDENGWNFFLTKRGLVIRGALPVDSTADC